MSMLKTMLPILAEGEVQHSGHLLSRVAAGAGVGHAQRFGDAVGREEHVTVLTAHLVVQVERKLIVGVDDRLHFRRQGSAQDRQTQAEDRNAGSDGSKTCKMRVHSSSFTQS